MPGSAGTSAGAITASLLASGLTVDRLEQILGALDFNRFLSQKTSLLVRNGDPSDDLDDPVYLVGNLKAHRPARRVLHRAAVQGLARRGPGRGGDEDVRRRRPG